MKHRRNIMFSMSIATSFMACQPEGPLASHHLKSTPAATKAGIHLSNQAIEISSNQDESLWSEPIRNHWKLADFDRNSATVVDQQPPAHKTISVFKLDLGTCLAQRRSQAVKLADFNRDMATTINGAAISGALNQFLKGHLHNYIPELPLTTAQVDYYCNPQSHLMIKIPAPDRQTSQICVWMHPKTLSIVGVYPDASSDDDICFGYLPGQVYIQAKSEDDAEEIRQIMMNPPYDQWIVAAPPFDPSLSRANLGRLRDLNSRHMMIKLKDPLKFHERDVFQKIATDRRICHNPKQEFPGSYSCDQDPSQALANFVELDSLVTHAGEGFRMFQAQDIGYNQIR